MAWNVVNQYCSSMDLSRSPGYNGLHCVNPFVANGNMLNLVSTSLSRKLCFSFKVDGRARAALISGEGDFLSYPSSNTISGRGIGNKQVGQPPGTELQPDAVAFGTFAAEMTPTGSFLADDDEFDLDSPTEGFSSIPEAIEDIRQGKFVIVVDDEDRENEGDFIMAASLVKPEDMAFIVKHGTGIVCVSMKGEDLERLQLPLMVSQKENDEKLSTAFTVSVDAKYGTTTGVSAHDRATTILALASRDSKPEDFNRPGHIFPLKYREGGVLKRAGHTEASVDLAVLAGLDPVAVLCEIVDDDGSMARLPKLRQFAQAENLKIISIADLIRYRRKRDKLVEKAADAPIPTMWGPFKAYCYRSLLDGIEHIAMVKDRMSKQQIGTCRRVGDLYVVESLHLLMATSQTAFSSFQLDSLSSPFYLWHSRLGHLSADCLRSLAQSGILSKVFLSELTECWGCKFAKMTALHFHKSTSISDTLFSLVHIDVWGPSPVHQRGFCILCVCC